MTAPSISITVEGMTCEGCATKVRDALTATPGIEGADIDVPTGGVVVRLDGSVPPMDLEFAIDEAVHNAGYRVV